MYDRLHANSSAAHIYAIEPKRYKPIWMNPANGEERNMTKGPRLTLGGNLG